MTMASSLGNMRATPVQVAGVGGREVGGARAWSVGQGQGFTSVEGATVDAQKAGSGEASADPAGMSFRAQWQTLVQRRDVERSDQESAGAMLAEAGAGTGSPGAAGGLALNRGANTTAQAWPMGGTSSPANSNAPDPAAMTLNTESVKTEPVKDDAASDEANLPDASELARQPVAQSSETGQDGVAAHSSLNERRVQHLSGKTITVSLTHTESAPGAAALAQPLLSGNLTNAMPTPDLPANRENSAGLNTANGSLQTEEWGASAGGRTGQPIAGASATSSTAACSSAQARIGTIYRGQGAPQGIASSVSRGSDSGIENPSEMDGERAVSDALPRQSEESASAPSANERVNANREANLGSMQGLDQDIAVVPGTKAFAFASPAAAAAATRAAGSGETIARASVEGAAQTAREKGAATSNNPVAHVAATQEAVAGTDSSLVMRVGAGERGAASGPNGVAGPSDQAAVSVAGNTRARETFAALDASSGVGSPGWIHAGHQSAEAGFEDPALGWVGVRADLSGGNVHAALIPGSAEAAQALSAHLPGLSAHLSEEHVPVSMVTMAAPKEGGLSLNIGQGQQQNAQQNDGRSGTGTSDLGEHDSQTSNFNEPRGNAAIGKVENGPAIWVGTRGTHISVMA